MEQFQSIIQPILAAQKVQVDVEGPNIGDAAEGVHVAEKLINESEVSDPTEAGDEAGVGERGEGEAAGDHVVEVVVLREVEAGLAEENADEAVVVKAEDAAA